MSFLSWWVRSTSSSLTFLVWHSTRLCASSSSTWQSLERPKSVNVSWRTFLMATCSLILEPSIQMVSYNVVLAHFSDGYMQSNTGTFNSNGKLFAFLTYHWVIKDSVKMGRCGLPRGKTLCKIIRRCICFIRIHACTKGESLTLQNYCNDASTLTVGFLLYI